jgi:SAM-dependent methyltransferase
MPLKAKYGVCPLGPIKATVCCILCGGKMRPLFTARDYRRPSDQAEYGLGWCDACSFGRLDGQFTPERVRRFYDIDYYTHSDVQQAAGKQSFLERVRNHLAWRADQGIEFRPSELGEPGDRTLCDIGCGNGNKLRKLKDAGFRVAAIEPDAKARMIAAKVANVFDGTAESYPFQIRDRRFDIAFMSHVLEHCIDPHTAVDNAASILAADGVLVIEVPNNAAKGFSDFGPLWPWCDIPRHINFFTETSLRALLRQHGFSCTAVNYLGYFRQFMPSWIAMQKEIFGIIGAGRQPHFGTKAWQLLFRTAFASPAAKYDSVRVHARRH